MADPEALRVDVGPVAFGTAPIAAIRSEDDLVGALTASRALRHANDAVLLFDPSSRGTVSSSTFCTVHRARMLLRSPGRQLTVRVAVKRYQWWKSTEPSTALLSALFHEASMLFDQSVMGSMHVVRTAGVVCPYPGEMWIVMEWVDWLERLSTAIPRVQAQPFIRRLQMIDYLVRALYQAHMFGVHGCVTAAKILFKNPNWEPVWIDFNLSTANLPSSSVAPEHAQLPPEQQSDPFRRTAAADMYAFGMLAQELLKISRPRGSRIMPLSPAAERFNQLCERILPQLVQACLIENPAERITSQEFVLMLNELYRQHPELAAAAAVGPVDGPRPPVRMLPLDRTAPPVRIEDWFQLPREDPLPADPDEAQRFLHDVTRLPPADGAARLRHAGPRLTADCGQLAQRAPVDSPLPDRLYALLVQAERLDGAAQLYHTLHDRRVAALGHEHPLTLRTGCLLGTLYARMGDTAAARSVLAPTLARLRRVLGPRDPLTLGCQSALGQALAAAGALDEARAALAEALEGQRAVLGAQHADTQATHGALLDVGRRLGEAAVRMPARPWERATGSATEAGAAPAGGTAATAPTAAAAAPASSSSSAAAAAATAAAAAAAAAAAVVQAPAAPAAVDAGSGRAPDGSLAGAAPPPPAPASLPDVVALLQQLRQGRPNTLEALEQMVSRDAVALGPEHPRTLLIQAQLGMQLVRHGRSDEGRGLLEAALALQERVCGPAHPATLLTYRDLGEVCLMQRDLVRARLMYEKAVAQLDQPAAAAALPVESQIHLRHGLGNVLLQQGELAAARRVMDGVVQEVEARYDDAHDVTLFVTCTLAHLLLLQGELAAARARLERVLAARPGPAQGDAAAEVLRARHTLGLVLLRQGDARGALRLLERVLRARERLHGSPSLEALDTLCAVAQAQAALQQTAVAVRLFRHVFETEALLFGVTSERTIRTMITVAHLMVHAGDPEAEVWGRRAQQLVRDVLGGNETLMRNATKVLTMVQLTRLLKL